MSAGAPTPASIRHTGRSCAACLRALEQHAPVEAPPGREYVARGRVTAACTQGSRSSLTASIDTFESRTDAESAACEVFRDGEHTVAEIRLRIGQSLTTARCAPARLLRHACVFDQRPA
jgi:hypothetical protein